MSLGEFKEGMDTIVNLDRVVCFSSKGLTLNDKTQVPVSSKRYPEIKRDITDFFEQK